MNKEVIKFLSCIVLCMLAVNASSQTKDIPADTLLKIADAGMDKYLNLIKKDNIDSYGFSSMNDLENIELGSPIQTYQFSKSFFNDNVLKNNEYITAQNEYRIPLIVNDTIRSFLIIGNINNEWTIAGVGGNILAKNIEKCIHSKNIDRKNKIILLREYHSQSDYLITGYGNKTMDEVFYPVDSPTSYLNKSISKNKLNKKEVLQYLHSDYHKNKRKYKTIKP